MFEGAHFHLIVNHVSLFALVFGVLVLAANFKWGGRDVLFIAIGLFIVAGIFTWAAHLTGEQAEHALKALMPDLDKSFIHEHEEASDFANIAGTLTALAAVVCAWIAVKRPSRLKPARLTLLIISIWAMSVFARVTYLGGLIRHTEIRGATVVPASPAATVE